MGNWKKPEEELPEDHKDVIFMHFNGLRSFGYYDKSSNKFWDYNGISNIIGGLLAYLVSSWCYIPEYDIKE